MTCLPKNVQTLKTTNSIKTVFATVRYQTVRSKDPFAQRTAKLMIFELVASEGTRFAKLMTEIGFNNGIEEALLLEHRGSPFPGHYKEEPGT